MKKFLCLSVLMLVLSVFSGNVLANDEVKKEDYVDGQLIVSVDASFDSKGKPMLQALTSTSKLLNAELKKNGFEVADSLLEVKGNDSVDIFSDSFKEEAAKNTGFVYLVEYSTDAYASIDDAKKALEKQLTDIGLKVKYVSENFTVELSAEAAEEVIQPAMHANQRWHYEMIRAPQAWNITTGSRNVRMAVLDTGIDSSHPNLANLVNTSLGRSFVGGTPADVHGHGTHVAGTIASYGSVSGVMQNATLISVKVLDNSGSGTIYGIQQGILYAASINADVINMSLGGGSYNQGMNDAIQTAVNSGTVVVAASGNNGASSISYPAAYSGAIAVGSVTSSRTRSSFSNYGSGLELMAPGSNIYSTYPNSRYATLSGTSMATPHVAGVAGLIRSVNPNLSAAQVRTILRNTAQYAGSSTQYGYGIVDAYAAVLSAR
ncbi:Subtilase family protein [Evansella caseinilytica]|uniref:Subtilase family protein n=1 Tax=Evansella caseinilytica TaxID=1503961 RepID=A0A1H3IP98_9BACI|nr:S8 family serine peptidase [Evansella caseinilytica]SDY28654.1 Subtilase family protein [Evansella caseinilytica]